ncbi:MAG TPA: 4-alpha-glucanotransferase, partial [Gammaproteobacteria bacterium]|nr:4-alpha-glucanotransferase [Gammaproteobacteria bacterium]
DFLAGAGQSVWQTLPLGPTHDDGSPYQCLSVHAGNPGFIDRDALREEGWLDGAPSGMSLAAAWQAFQARADTAARHDFEAFCAEHKSWLDDYALYCAIREEQGHQAWWHWPAPLRDREPTALEEAGRRLADAVGTVRFGQFVFFRQWAALKHYANQRGVLMFGDMPIFVAHDSADVWAERQYFQLDERGQPTVVAGVPPDYFSATGQRWGNPHYDWDRMGQDGYAWWLRRMATQLQLFDLIRIDHFRGFEAYWEIPAGHDTAQGGRWVQGPGDALFEAFHARFGELPVVAEDLGVITEAVTALRLRHRLPGMKILQFAFDSGPGNPYLPHHHEPLYAVYTGTHDNDTTLGWYRSLPEAVRAHVNDYLACVAADMPWALIRAALASVATLAIVPLQDILELGSEHRMNTPGTTTGNWAWRFRWAQVSGDAVRRLRHMTGLYGRLAQ